MENTKSYIKNPDKSIIPPLKQNDEIYANDKDKANVLNSYIKSQTNLDDSGKALPVIDTMNNNQLSILQTNSYEVQLMLETLKTGKASGPDTINNYILKNCAHELSPPLAECFFKISYSTDLVERSKCDTCL